MSKFITLNKRQLCDFELIINGAFHPLKGFMNKKDYFSCIYNMYILNGFFPIPITLCIDEKTKIQLEKENSVILKDETGLILGEMDISDKENSIYKSDIKTECLSVFNCYDDNHPYIQILNDYQKNGLIYNIGGEILNYKKIQHYDFEDIRLTPSETKEFFKKNNWKNIIGFQTRNPMHRSHYELTLNSMENINDSKLLIHPVVGITQDSDINYFTRVKCYNKIMKYYNQNNVKLSLLPLSMRMAGPKEALLHALIRKNYGCTHFIVGRDHAGPSSKRKDGKTFFEPYDAQKILLKFADVIDIIPIISKEIVYTVDENSIGNYSQIDKIKKNSNIFNISGTEFRNMINNNLEVPSWYSFPEVIQELKLNKNIALCLYFVGLSGSGKSTMCNHMMSKFKELTNKKVSILDGDIVRLNLSKGLGFSKEDRSTNIRRIGYVASEITKHDGIVLVANIAPFEDDRKFNKNLISQYGNYVEIFMDTDIEECEKRDVKGLYKLARKGEIKNFTGIDSPFEKPQSDIILDGKNSIKENINIILNYLNEIKYNFII